MKHTDTILFLNPSSKSKKGQLNWPCFRQAGFKEIISASAEDMILKVKENPCKTAVAVGGDGTINLVINGLMQSNTPRKLGVLYSGTSPDFCRFHGISVNPKEALSQLTHGKPHTIDICKIQYEDGKSYYFASSCNIGLGSEIARISNKIRKYFGDTLGTLIAALKSLFTLKYFAATLNIDGQVKTFPKLRHIAVLKNKFIASGLYLNVDVKPDDGLIYVVALPQLTLKDLLHIYKGKIPNGAYVFACKDILVKTQPTQCTEFDGDPKPIGDVHITCLPKRLEIIK